MSLSPEQKRALGLTQDSVIAAGAGSGKTTTLASAVIYDLRQGVAAEEIAVCTFTRSAAANILSRIEELRSEEEKIDGLWIGTIDALASRYLRSESWRVGISPDFQPAEDRVLFAMKKQALRHALSDLRADQIQVLSDRRDLSSRDFLQLVDRAAEQARVFGVGAKSWIAAKPDPEPFRDALQELADILQSPSQLEAIQADLEALEQRPENLGTSRWHTRKGSRYDVLVDQAVSAREEYRQSCADYFAESERDAYADLLAAYGEIYHDLRHKKDQLDFLDISEKALLSARPIWRRVYLDEAQDSNSLQMNLLRSLASGPLIAIGDINQSIYSFRGADPEAFRNLEKGADKITLSTNYRSHAGVLNTISSLLRSSPDLRQGWIDQVSPHLDPLQHPPVEAVLYSTAGRYFPRAEEEAQAVVDHFLAQAQEREIAWSDIAVLVRSNSEVSSYVEAIRSRGVPALALQNQGLFAQPEIKDLLAYMRLLQEDDMPALLRVLSSPFLSLSDEELLEISPDIFTLSRERYPDFFARLDRFREMLGSYSVWRILQMACEENAFDLSLYLLDDTGSRWRNVEKAIERIRIIELDTGPDIYTLLDEVEQEALANSEGQDTRIPEGLDAVKVMTIHQAKGDEFRMVVAARLARSSRKNTDPLAIDESGKIGISGPFGRDSVLADVVAAQDLADRADEQRLLYVALTRAKEFLLLVASGKEGSGKKIAWGDPWDSLPVSSIPGPDKKGSLRLEDGSKIPATHYRQTRAQKQIYSSERLSGKKADAPLSEIHLPEPVVSSLSYSSLSDWRRCGRRKLLEGKLRLDPSDMVVQSGSGQRQLGLEIHEVLAQMNWGSGDVVCKKKDIQKYLNRLRESEIYPLLVGKSPQTEKSFVLVLDNFLLRGRIDLLLPGEEWLVIDWKTGEEEDFWQEDYLLQRKIYALSALRTGASSVRSISFSLHNSKLEENTFALSDTPLLQADISAEISRILSQPEEPASQTQQPFCRGCPGLERGCVVALSLKKD